MFDHITVTVSNVEESKRFYEKTLAPLGYRVLFGEERSYWGFGKARPQFWISQQDESHLSLSKTHIAFSCPSQQTVNDFYHAALSAGGRDNGKPGLRPEYHEDYYGAFVIDPDGNNIEAVHENE